MSAPKTRRPEMESIRFTCQRGCINCCTQEGRIYITEDDLVRAAKFVSMTPKAFEKKHVVRTSHELRFRKPRKKQCPFLVGSGCSIHPAKPTQCRTFPFWPELLEREVEWNEAATYCPGIGQGPLIQIAAAMEIAEEQRSAYPHMYIVED